MHHILRYTRACDLMLDAVHRGTPIGDPRQRQSSPQVHPSLETPAEGTSHNKSHSQVPSFVENLFKEGTSQTQSFESTAMSETPPKGSLHHTQKSFASTAMPETSPNGKSCANSVIGDLRKKVYHKKSCARKRFWDLHKGTFHKVPCK